MADMTLCLLLRGTAVKLCLCREQLCMYVRTYVRTYVRMRMHVCMYEGHLESKERFAIKKYLLIIGKKKNMQVLSHTFTYFST